MFDIPSHCRAVEKRLSDAGLHIADVLKTAGVDRSSWTRWKNGKFSPRLTNFQSVEVEVERALSKKRGAA